MTNGLIRLGYGTGTNQMVLGMMLAAAVTLDIRWLKNRHKVLNEVYVAPIFHRMGETQSALPGSGTPYALDDRLSGAEAIGLGELEGPEDVVLDEQDHLYCGTRHGEIVRFLAPDYKRSEIFAHTGGFPLGSPSTAPALIPPSAPWGPIPMPGIEPAPPRPAILPRSRRRGPVRS
jgi:ribose transport system permease protein